MKKYIFLLFVLLMVVVTATGCASKDRVLSSDEQKPILEYTEPMTDNLLAALQSGSYTDFTRDMDKVMVKAMPEDAFNKLRDQLSSKVGTYTSRSVKSVVETGSYYAVVYAAVYENAPEVTIRVVFNQEDPHLISGLWLNSPELSK